MLAEFIKNEKIEINFIPVLDFFITHEGNYSSFIIEIVKEGWNVIAPSYYKIGLIIICGIK